MKVVVVLLGGLLIGYDIAELFPTVESSHKASSSEQEEAGEDHYPTTDLGLRDICGLGSHI